MKRIPLILLLLSLLGCDNSPVDDSNTKFFDAARLKELNLLEIDNYWDKGIEIDTSYYMGATFDLHLGFIEGMCLYSGNEQ